MGKWIESISRVIGFTKTETTIVVFILSAFVVGLAVNIYKEKSNKAEYLEFDYSEEDSLFNAALNKVPINEDDAANEEEKIVASKNELLDFGSSKNKIEEKAKPKLAAKVVNINSANISELTTLPGIGAKTAENILAYRKKIGKFTKAEELLNIKGIGKTKFSKIKDQIKF